MLAVVPVQVPAAGPLPAASVNVLAVGLSSTVRESLVLSVSCYLHTSEDVIAASKLSLLLTAASC